MLLANQIHIVYLCMCVKNLYIIIKLLGQWALHHDGVSTAGHVGCPGVWCAGSAQRQRQRRALGILHFLTTSNFIAAQNTINICVHFLFAICNKL